MLKIIVFCVIFSIGILNTKAIFNGETTERAQHHVHIVHINNVGLGNFGGGSLISNQHVLTVAQMITGFVQWNCGIGNVHFTQLIRVVSSQAVPHPSYNAISGDNDIGLIFLPQPIVFSFHTGPIALPPLNNINLPYTNEQGKTLGFGLVVPGGSQVDFLQRGFQRVLDNCTMLTVPEPNIFCAQDIERNTNLCQGDVGGSFTIILRNVETLVGIASIIIDACSSQFPSGYTRVSVHRQWIRDQVGV